MNEEDIIIPNRVFVGCAWKPEKPKYERIAQSLEKRFPIHFILMGRERTQLAAELFALIKKALFSSSWAIFDVTNGNPNVSLEYGLAEARNMEIAIYFSAHGHSKRKIGEGAIISDLAGQRRNQYKTEAGLLRLLTEFCKDHPFTKRFDEALKRSTRNIKSRHKKRSYRTMGLKLIRYFDGKDAVRRNDLVSYLQGEKYRKDDIELLLKGFHINELVQISRGNPSEVRIR